MNVHELKMKFHQLREYTPENVNELLDFAKRPISIMKFPVQIIEISFVSLKLKERPFRKATKITPSRIQ